MTLREFVTALRQERDALLAGYAAREPTSHVGALLAQANLTGTQRESALAALHSALTDAFYTILLGLDGAAPLGGTQRSYRLVDENGVVISAGDGALEELAYELFQDQGAGSKVL
jgi:hypothetical protein